MKAKRIGVPLCWNPPPRTAADCGAGHAGGDRRVLPSGGEARRGRDAAEWGVEWDIGVRWQREIVDSPAQIRRSLPCMVQIAPDLLSADPEPSMGRETKGRKRKFPAVVETVLLSP